MNRRLCYEPTFDIISRCSEQFKNVSGNFYVYTLPQKFDLEIPSYINVSDSDTFLESIRTLPNIKVLVMTPVGAEYVLNRISNEVITIYENHCNYDRELRTRKEVKVVGYSGSQRCLGLNPFELKGYLKNVGLEFKVLWLEESTTRKEIVDFYKTIDISIAYRIPYIRKPHPPEMKGTIKLTSPGSFKIPTVAFPDCVYKGLNLDCYVKAYSIKDVVNGCKLLATNKDMYETYSNLAYEYAKDKHIDTIVKQYNQLIN